MGRVLVTGANGFVGRYVCRQLLNDGHWVRGTVRREDAARPLPDAIAPFETGPVESFRDWESALAGVTHVVHLIARAHVIHETAADPLAAYRDTNVETTRRLARAAAAAGVSRFVFMSSIGAVGRRFAEPALETDACQPVDEYGTTKLEAEQALAEIASAAGMETTILRPPLVYGPGVAGNFLRIAKLVRRGIPLPVGCLTSPRSMIGVRNLADAVSRCLTHPAAANRLYHVTDAETITTRQLVEQLATHANRSPRVVPVPEFLLKVGGAITGRSKDVGRLTDPLLVSNQRIRQELDWTPPIALSDELRETRRSLPGRGTPGACTTESGLMLKRTFDLAVWPAGGCGLCQFPCWP